MITYSLIPTALKPGIDFWIGETYNMFPAEWKEIFEQRTSGQNFEQAVSHFGFGLAVLKPQGGAVSYDDDGQGGIVRFTHNTYALAYKITKEAIDDNLYNNIAESRSKFLGQSMAETENYLGALILDRAFNSTYTGGYLADQLCKTDHALIRTGGTQSNRSSTDADLSEASLQQMRLDVHSFKNDAGLKTLLMPQKLIIHQDNQYVAETLFKTEFEVNTANNNINTIRSMGVVPGGYVINHYLSDSDAWFVTTNAQNGMLYYLRTPMETRVDMADFDTNNIGVKMEKRFSFGWGDYRTMYGSQGS